MEIKKYLLASAASLACAAFGAYLYSRYVAAQPSSVAQPTTISAPAHAVAYGQAAPTDFTDAAAMTVNSVVHIKVTQQSQQQDFGGSDLFDFFFGQAWDDSSSAASPSRAQARA